MSIAVLIPSYDRPGILDLTLPFWLRSRYVSRILVAAEASSKDVMEKYRYVLRRYEKSNKLTYTLRLGRLGSVKARNILLEMASSSGYEYVLMGDDDYIPNLESLSTLIEDFNLDDRIGAVGGRVLVARQRRTDPDFFLNTPIRLADQVTRLIGYVFLDVRNGPRYAEFLPPFYAVRREILDRIRYDELYDTPTAFREESDVHQQIKRLGYKLLIDPRITVIHLAVEEGGNRPRISMRERMYWKSRNHAAFILKWERRSFMRIWYVLSSTLLLSLYRPWHALTVFKGLKDGIRAYYELQ